MRNQQKNVATKSPEETAVNIKREAVKQARWRMFWKFCAILAALLAYTFLRGIEGAKSSYDEERSRPVVIVNDNDANKVAADLKKAIESGQDQATEKALHDARLLRVSEVKKVFDEKTISGSETGFTEETLQGVRETIEKIKYQSFKDEKELIGSLDDEILAGADYKKKALLATEEAESKAQASKLPDLTQDKLAVIARLEEIYKSENGVSQETKLPDESFNQWVQKKTEQLIKSNKFPVPTEKELIEWHAMISGVSSSLNEEQRVSGRRRNRQVQPQTSNSLNEDNLLRWLAAIDRRSTDESRLLGIKDKIDVIDKKAQEQIRAVYTKLKPKLPELLKGAVNAPQGSDSWLAFFSPRSVLDEKSGVHVIYRTLWLACVMVLVFGLICVILLMLRPLPFFARGTDMLMEHAGELFKRSEGVAPQLAKSIAVTAAALGVGAAIAVAGSNTVTRKPLDGDGGGYVETSGQGEGGQPGTRGPKGPGGTSGEGGVVEHVIKLSEPIVYPSPMIVNVPTTSTPFDPAFLNGINTQLGELRSKDDALDSKLNAVVSTELNPLQLRFTNLYDRTNDLPIKVDNAQLRVDQINKDLTYLSQTRIPAIEKNYTDVLLDLKKQLESTNSAVADLRDNSLERLHNSGGRNILTRTAQVFKGDRYLITSQSLKSLTALMRKLPNECPDSSGYASTKKCCGSTPTEVAYCSDPAIEAILTKLYSMVGEPPVSESAFMKELRTAKTSNGTPVDKIVIDRWKSIILKYVRVAY